MKKKSAGLVILALLTPSLAFAHGGGLDSIGCHHDRKRGFYHCHRGPLAGQSFANEVEAQAALREAKKDIQDENIQKTTAGK